MTKAATTGFDGGCGLNKFICSCSGRREVQERGHHRRAVSGHDDQVVDCFKHLNYLSSVRE